MYHLSKTFTLKVINERIGLQTSNTEHVITIISILKLFLLYHYTSNSIDYLALIMILSEGKIGYTKRSLFL